MQYLNPDEIDNSITISEVLILLFNNNSIIIIFFIIFWYLVSSLLDKNIEDIIFFSCLFLSLYFIYPTLIEAYYNSEDIISLPSDYSILIIFIICCLLQILLLLIKKWKNKEA